MLLPPPHVHRISHSRPGLGWGWFESLHMNSFGSGAYLIDQDYIAAGSAEVNLPK